MEQKMTSIMKKYINPAFVDVYEVYSEKIFICNNNIAIPYINIGLMPENPITHEQSVVDFSYCVFTGITSIEINSNNGNLQFDFKEKEENKSFIEEYLSFGGYKSDYGAEMKIVCESMLYFLPDTATIKRPIPPFVPIDTPNFKMNMDCKKIEAFFTLTNLPQEIKSILGKDIICTFIAW